MFQGNHMRQKASRRLFKDISHSPSFFTQSSAFVRAYEPPFRPRVVCIRALPDGFILPHRLRRAQAVGEGLGKASSAFGKGFGPAQVEIRTVMSPSLMRT